MNSKFLFVSMVLSLSFCYNTEACSVNCQYSPLDLPFFYSGLWSTVLVAFFCAFSADCSVSKVCTILYFFLEWTELPSQTFLCEYVEGTNVFTLVSVIEVPVYICRSSDSNILSCLNSCLLECTPATQATRVRFPSETCFVSRGWG
jgi:hypothetical protein